VSQSWRLGTRNKEKQSETEELTGIGRHEWIKLKIGGVRTAQFNVNKLFSTMSKNG
jgi:hypothetical protein